MNGIRLLLGVFIISASWLLSIGLLNNSINMLIRIPLVVMGLVLFGFGVAGMAALWNQDT